jgi:hypothetical protein
LAASSVHSVLFEIAVGFGLPRRVEFLLTLGTTVGKALGLGEQVVLPPLGSLSRRPQIGHISHVASRR